MKLPKNSLKHGITLALVLLTWLQNVMTTPTVTTP